MIGDHEIPFLSFAAFQKLLDLPLVRFFAKQYGREDAEKLIPTAALASPEIFALGVPAEKWEGDEGTARKMQLALLVSKRHAWADVLDFIRFGKPRAPGEEDVSADRFQAGLLSFCQRNPFYSPADLAALPFDYVYALLEAQQDLNETSEEGADFVQRGDFSDVAGTPEQREGVLSAIARAREAAN